MGEKEFLDSVVSSYISSFNYDGYIANELSESLRDIIENLIRNGMLNVITNDCENVFVKNFPIKANIEQQIKRLSSGKFVVLFPTKKTMMKYTDKEPEGYFSKMLFYGDYQLKSLFFKHEVLRKYLDNPSYLFFNQDTLHYTICANDEYKDDNDDEYLECALAYRNDRTRCITAFLCDLARMPVKAQRYWEYYLLTDKCFLHPNYVTSQIKGDFYKGASIFQAISDEINVINEQCKKIGLPFIFKKSFTLIDDELRDFRPISDATSKEFLAFAVLLYKVVLEQISIGTFQKSVGVVSGLSKENIYGLTKEEILIMWIRKNVRGLDEDDLKIINDAFVQLGRDRNFQSHEIYENRKDHKIFKRQKKLVYKVYCAVRQIRLILQNHPVAKDVDISKYLVTGENIWEY